VGTKFVAAFSAAGFMCVSLFVGAAQIGAAQAELAIQKIPQKTADTAKPTVPKIVPKQAAAAYASAFESGLASVYCFRNGPTASGERSRPAVLTAAHKTLPFGTLVEVTNRENGRSIVVRINDRGPFVAGRVIDLTPAGARALKFDGLTNVTVRVLNNQRDSRIVARAI
jgi:rare lipoprotein A